MVDVQKGKMSGDDTEDVNPEYEKWSILEEDENKGEEIEGKLPSPEEKERNLTFEKLSGLSTEQYLEMWQQLNPFFVTHVTRQGIRDHVGMFYHSAGLGSFANGFKGILEDGKRLCSPAEVNFGLPPNFTEEDVAKTLDKMVFSSDEYDGWNPEQILNVLPFNSTIASADPWADKQAIHFAQHTVLNELYGGENDNEAFFVFPTDVVASQCQFGGHMHNDLITAQVEMERKWNDMFVWAKNGEIPVDAGLVFLPKSTMVDRETGSRYATREVVDENGNVSLVPEKDEDRIGRFKDWLMGLSEESTEVKVAREHDLSLMKDKLKEIGIPAECISEMVEYGNVYGLLSFVREKHFNNLWMEMEQLEKMSQEEKTDYSIREYLRTRNADLKFAENVVPAEEYWEQYFSEHPEQKPAHIIYYDGNPSEAIKSLLAEKGILESTDDYSYRSGSDFSPTMTGVGDSSERDGKMLGFDEHFIGDGTKDEHLTAEHERFNELALKILRERLGREGEDSGD